MNRLKEYHPTAVFLYFLFCIAISMITTNPIWVLCSFLSASFYFIELHGFRAYLLRCLYFMPMLLIIMLFNSLFNSLGLTVLFYLGKGNPVTVENLTFGFFSGLILLTIYLWFACYSELISSDEIMTIFGFRFPTLGLAISMITKYVPDTLEQGREILYHQKVLLGPKQLKGKEKIGFSAKLMTTLLSWSMENALETSDSMRAKGYPSKKRVNYSRLRFNGRDRNLIILLVSLLLGHLVFVFWGAVKFMYYPFLKWQGKELGLPILLLTFLSLWLLYLIPLFLNLGQWLSWQKINRTADYDLPEDMGIIVYDEE